MHRRNIERKMIIETVIEFDDSEFTRDSALCLAREGLRRKQQEKADCILIVSAFPNRPDVVVEFQENRIVLKTKNQGDEKL